MLGRRIEPSSDLPHACQRFLDDLRDWAYYAIDRYQNEPPSNVHDQGTYTTGWEPLLHACPDERILRFLQRKRDSIRDHFATTQQWRHGYWRMQEAHHGTEHYELFLGALHRLLPHDQETTRQLHDVAEHMGNWSAGVPDWFDWDRRRFHSIFFGADGLRSGPGMALNTPDHLRCINICLLAAAQPAAAPAESENACPGPGGSRYVELAAIYAGEWVDAILAGDALPIALTDDGVLYQFNAEDRALYYSFMGEASDLQSEVDRAENLLGSNAVDTFLRMWRHTGQLRFRRAAEKILEPLASQLTDADAGAAASAVRAYRRCTGGRRFDARLLQAVERLDPFNVTEISLDTEFKRPARRLSGVGKRSDAPRWLENGRERRHNPITLAAAAEITGDTALQTRAVDLARAYFLLARAAFPDGRDHGCSARSVSALARGHGRENHAGMTTAVLGPALGLQ